MALPKQVEQQLKELDELEKQMQAPQEGQTAVVEEPTPTTVDSTPEVTPQQPVAAVVSEDVWEHKYRTLQSKYDAEVPRLHAQLRDLSGQMQQMQRQPEPPKEPAKQLVTDQDRESFGEDLIDLQRRVAREVAAEFRDEVSALRQENASLRAAVADTGNRVGEMTFEQRLQRTVPDFDALNNDPRWVQWLDGVDPILRGPRRAVAQQAFSEGDVDAVAHYVHLFKQTLTANQPDNRQAELERQVAPSRSASAPSVGGGAKMYTVREAEKAFDRVRDLNISGKYDEATKLEAEISAAYMTGRVR